MRGRSFQEDEYEKAGVEELTIEMSGAFSRLHSSISLVASSSKLRTKDFIAVVKQPRSKDIALVWYVDNS